MTSQERQVINHAVAWARASIRNFREQESIPNRALTAEERELFIDGISPSLERLLKAVEHVVSVGSRKKPRKKTPR